MAEIDRTLRTWISKQQNELLFCQIFGVVHRFEYLWRLFNPYVRRCSIYCFLTGIGAITELFEVILQMIFKISLSFEGMSLTKKMFFFDTIATNKRMTIQQFVQRSRSTLLSTDNEDIRHF